ncbi:hypothetical protein SAMN04489727_1739 [Amycolatopsis tolypomycina]|uniref:Uncharacterized protein n=1 Tax=Amycolatopsis tolypomycina TaxID=208445 RepID=A0A1H4JC11_9PSEU|nr:hypothetical protein [Amycolatopsis tolypomycina]SEB43741.1 hypothetical protein SAMN04489727_1739 [Amycolatopsis tolypomycina]
MADRNPTPEELQDLADHMRAFGMRRRAALLQLQTSIVTAAIAARGFARAVRSAELKQFDELRQHPDVLEIEIATGAWYPEAGRS